MFLGLFCTLRKEKVSGVFLLLKNYDGEIDRPSEPSRLECQREGGNFGKAEGGKTGCNGTTENAESDEMDWINE
ncbi:Uncharacterised protein [uncultured Clostridium sp.]|jgi:hypothetical protein|nr:Uncharacterised protein [uncultured Clostridium sp.]